MWRSACRHRVAVIQCATFTIVFAGISLIVGHRGGIFWLGGGARVAFAGSVANGWIFLDEVMRHDRPRKELDTDASVDAR